MESSEIDSVTSVPAQTLAILARLPTMKRFTRCLAFYLDKEPAKFYLALKSVLPMADIRSFGPYEWSCKYVKDPKITSEASLEKVLEGDDEKYDLMLFIYERLDKTFVSKMRPVLEERLMKEGISLFATKDKTLEVDGLKIFSNPRYKVMTKALDMTEALFPSSYKILNVCKKY